MRRSGLSLQMEVADLAPSSSQVDGPSTRGPTSSDPIAPLMSPGASSEVVGGDEPGRGATRGGPTLKVGIQHARRTRTFSYSVL